MDQGQKIGIGIGIGAAILASIIGTVASFGAAAPEAAAGDAALVGAGTTAIDAAAVTPEVAAGAAEVGTGATAAAGTGAVGTTAATTASTGASAGLGGGSVTAEAANAGLGAGEGVSASDVGDAASLASKGYGVANQANNIATAKSDPSKPGATALVGEQQIQAGEAKQANALGTPSSIDNMSLTGPNAGKSVDNASTPLTDKQKAAIASAGTNFQTSMNQLGKGPGYQSAMPNAPQIAPPNFNQGNGLQLNNMPPIQTGMTPQMMLNNQAQLQQYNPYQPPPLALSDQRSKKNIRIGEEQMNKILNNIYKKLVK